MLTKKATAKTSLISASRSLKHHDSHEFAS